jgi:hypothetical protein
MYCCFTREPQALCRVLKCTWTEDSAVAYIFTGMETIPNETIAVPIGRALMVGTIY